MTRRALPPVTINLIGQRRPAIDPNAPVPPAPPPPPPPPPADAWLVQGTPGGYFIDPANSFPSGVSRLTWRGDFWFPTLPTNTPMLFSKESNGCDIQLLSTGALRATIEDSTGARVMTNIAIAPVGTVVANTPFTLVVDVNHATAQVTVTVNGGTPIVTAFSVPGSGSFEASVRELSFLANTAGLTIVPAGARFRYLSVDIGGTPYKAISNNAALANTDTWKQGGELTNA